jgi:hydroxylamine reductase
MSMFCYQCQETAGGKACTKRGVCGKTSELANLQDLLMYVIKGVSVANIKARELGVNKLVTEKFVFNGLFMTITNANWDNTRFYAEIKAGLKVRDEIKAAVINAGGVIESDYEGLTWTGSTDAELEAKSESGDVSILQTKDEDIRSLRELLTYGIKGMAAYVEHSFNLGSTDQGVFEFMEKGLAATTDNRLGVNEYVALVLECGKFGVDAMALLDQANTTAYGNPEITKVNIGVRGNPAILVSGHDLKDLEQLLAQTDGTGVDIYTHSEMLPAHYYPAFKKYSHFVGNYGNAWWLQDKEFESFNGVILMTTNCIVPPKASYKDRMFTTGATGIEGVKHVDKNADGIKDFSELIALAKTLPAPTEIEKGEIVGGFAHAQVLALADSVVDAVKTGAIKRFFVMAGCDGRMKSRDYYTEFADKLPKDTVILTAGCAKYRYNKLNLGDINGIPRVLDAGQCNDSYSLAIIALKLKEVFGLQDINELPISYNIAWYEQKAVIVLLALLHLGVKNIHLGPTLPGFLSANVTKVLVENFGIGGVSNVDDDMKMFMGA